MTTLTMVTTDEVKDFVKNASKSNDMTMSQFVSVILEKAAVNGAFYNNHLASGRAATKMKK